MKLKLENVARVSSATIELGGITVVAGSNGSGKSTISRSLVTLCSVSGRSSELIRNERLRSVLGVLQKSSQKVGIDIAWQGLSFFWGRRGDDGFRHWPQEDVVNLLSSDWWADKDNVCKWLQDSKYVYVGSGELKSDARFQQIFDEVREGVNEVLARGDGDYAKHVCKKSFGKAFNRQIRPVFGSASDLGDSIESLISIESDQKDGSALRKLGVKFCDGECSEQFGLGGKWFSSFVYFEPLNTIDFANDCFNSDLDRYTAGSLSAANIVAKKPPKDLSLEDQKELDELKGIVKELVELIHGRIVDGESELRFREKFSNEKEYEIDLLNIASGMKTIAAIVRAVENRSIKKESMLVFDEPESNLHPEWQVRLAFFLVMLVQKTQISLLVNTHSPYFLQALWKFSHKEKVPNHFYHMIPDGDTDSFTSNDVTEKIDDVFRTMYQPFHELMGK